MIEYAFDTITPDQAAAIKAADTVTFNGASARTVSVVYQSYDPLALSPEVPRILVTYGGRTLSFSTNLVEVSSLGGLVMADGSKLYIGDMSDNSVVGAAGDDGLYGGPGNDTLDGGAGADLLQGNGGDDDLRGGDGGDTIYGGGGNDVIHTARGVVGGPDDAGDFAHGNLGDDEIVGGGGRDTLLGGQGNDFIAGAGGDDVLSGDLGDDELHGGLGNDTLNGGAGNDILQGGFGQDVLNGGDGDDQLVAQGPEIAVLLGGAGNDTLTAAGSDKDILEGGSGRDVFEIVATTPPAVRVEAEIRDWEAHDTLHFPEVTIFTAAAILPHTYAEIVAGSYEEALRAADSLLLAPGARYVAVQVGGDVFVFADLGDPEDGADVSVLLAGRTLADIGPGNFA